MPLLRKKGMLDSQKVLFLPLESIAPNPNQPRKHFSSQALEELAVSIRAVGLLQPLTVRRSGAQWELIAGERRLRACKLAGLREVPCLVIQADSALSAALALVENIQRRDLDFWEEAQALERLISQCGLSQEEAARRVGKSQSAVANKLRLLKLPPDVLETLRGGGGSERHARALLSLPTPALQLEAARRVVEEKMTVAQTEEMVQRMLNPEEYKKPERQRIYVVKDVRLFLNTLNRGLDLMRSAGVQAQCDREDREEEIQLTIRIPRALAKST